jgi:hypothetical protein
VAHSGTETRLLVAAANRISSAVAAAGSSVRSFRYTSRNDAGLRRLADSNRCPVPLHLAQPCGIRPTACLTTDFVTAQAAS